MIALPPALHAALRANDLAHRSGDSARAALDPLPVLKLFNPLGPATWLATELGEDSDTLFGLADLGFGCPELGYFSLGEIAGLRLPFGRVIERDLSFDTIFPLSLWTETARRTGSIIGAERRLRRAARTAPDPDADPDLPPSGG